MKRLQWLTLPLGLIVLVVLIRQQNLGEVADLIGAAGWGLLWLLPFHAIPLLFDAQGWRIQLRKAPLGFLLWVAAVREAVNRLLPVASIGGELVGIRMASWCIPDGSLVTATIIIETLVTMAVQYVFAAAGVLITLASLTGTQDHWLHTAALGLVLSVPLPIAAAVLIKRGGVFHAIERWASHLPGIDLGALGIDGQRLDADLDRLLSRPLKLFWTFLWQLAGYVIGSFEIWLALTLLGHPVSIGGAIAIEALTQAVRHAAFFIPGGVGVQEATVLLLAQAFGVPHEAALSLALIKRAREVIFGCLALASWHILELARSHQPKLSILPKVRSVERVR